MRDVETILADMAVKNEAYDTLIKVYDLFKDEKIDEAKALINSTVKSNNNKQNPSNILHRILKMVYEFSESKYRFEDVIKYHSEYRNIIDISGFGDDWIYGDSLSEITEISEAVVSLASDILPNLYDELLMQTSKFDINSMNCIFKYIDYSLLEPVSKMMLAIEHIDVYNMHNFICEGMPIETIFKACDEIEDLE